MRAVFPLLIESNGCAVGGGGELDFLPLARCKTRPEGDIGSLAAGVCDAVVIAAEPLCA